MAFYPTHFSVVVVIWDVNIYRDTGERETKEDRVERESVKDGVLSLVLA